MNRNAKAGIAVGAATILLLGGGGTFALWQSSTTLTATSVTSGQLELSDASVDGEWYRYVDGQDLADYDPLTDAIDMTTWTIVPEDELIFIAEVGLTAEGGDLYFTVDSTLGGDAAADGFTVGITVLEEDAVTPLTSITAASGQFTGVAENDTVYNVDAADEVVTTTFLTGVPVSFDADNTDDQSVTQNLAEAAINVNQVVLVG
ncbi:hypothetical protein GCM10009808_16670 [Microbacterium sediminicola]|uniref:Alternate signal-mediated exported protein, RER_14450 family n=1 Tax=Microbacterium sediminicola TaxID=415210 RepID=A0ABN2I6Y5_9MICO